MLGSGMAGKAGYGPFVKASFGVLSFGRQGTSGRVKSRQVRSGQGKAGKVSRVEAGHGHVWHRKSWHGRRGLLGYVGARIGVVWCDAVRQAS